MQVEIFQEKRDNYMKIDQDNTTFELKRNKKVIYLRHKKR